MSKDMTIADWVKQADPEPCGDAMEWAESEGMTMMSEAWDGVVEHWYRRGYTSWLSWLIYYAATANEQRHLFMELAKLKTRGGDRTILDIIRDSYKDTDVLGFLRDGDYVDTEPAFEAAAAASQYHLLRPAVSPIWSESVAWMSMVLLSPAAGLIDLQSALMAVSSLYVGDDDDDIDIIIIKHNPFRD